MARRKTLPESVRAKYALAERLSALRLELFGDRGGPELARRLALPVRTWYNYEDGVTVPAEVVLKIIELTAVEPIWLLRGEGPKFRSRSTIGIAEGAADSSSRSVGALLRTALDMLEQEQEFSRTGPRPGFRHGRPRQSEAVPRAEGEEAPDEEQDEGVVLIGVDDDHGAATAESVGPRYVAARPDWLDAERECRCIRVAGNAMEPIVADGACVAISRTRERLSDLDGKLVVAWIDEHPVVRWFEFHGKFALLKAENPRAEPAQQVIEIDDASDDLHIRRVLWVSTPH